VNRSLLAHRDCPYAALGEWKDLPERLIGVSRAGDHAEVIGLTGR
jgi:hypothetical protein